jgi:threonine dehydrogenase-like Zn-dependent dehydrogenase
MTRIAIHGFGRIGRATLRAALHERGFTPVAVSNIKELATLAALFAVDSNYGRWPEAVRADEAAFRIGDRAIPYYNVATGRPGWGALGIDVVIECSGRATTRAGAQPHLDRGAKHVLVSAPSKTLEDADAVLLPGSTSISSTRSGTRSSIWAAAPQRAGPSRQGHPRALGRPQRLLHNRSRLHQLAVADRPADGRPARLLGRG